ncbi:hypothetical protein D1BOALGB6SA_2824 [Olavius sp. associated proteobacterium Delta 1]|nr:hypothetical protein D1BOALGB6SA_2824 [Olavius sp. associated proteobacterium Delta 1]
MTQKGFKRKLTAILVDVVGYSRLMRDDGEATVRDIAAHRVLITEIIQQHHGRTVSILLRGWRDWRQPAEYQFQEPYMNRLRRL